jgi:hypothetical protein
MAFHACQSSGEIGNIVFSSSFAYEDRRKRPLPLVIRVAVVVPQVGAVFFVPGVLGLARDAAENLFCFFEVSAVLRRVAGIGRDGFEAIEQGVHPFYVLVIAAEQLAQRAFFHEFQVGLWRSTKSGCDFHMGFSFQVSGMKKPAGGAG